MPLLELIAKYTGLNSLTLLGGAPPKNAGEGFQISVLNFGKTKLGQDFQSYDDGRFSSVLSHFAQFVGAVAGKSLTLLSGTASHP